MEEKKNKPDEILRVIQEDEQSSKNGHLKIFFGYAAGVGKTYAMLMPMPRSGAVWTW